MPLSSRPVHFLLGYWAPAVGGTATFAKTGPLFCLQEVNPWQQLMPENLQRRYSTEEPWVLRLLEPLVAAGFAPTIWHTVALPDRLAERFGLAPGAVLGSLDLFEFYSQAVSDRCELCCDALGWVVLYCAQLAAARDRARC